MYDPNVVVDGMGMAWSLRRDCASRLATRESTGAAASAVVMGREALKLRRYASWKRASCAVAEATSRRVPERPSKVTFDGRVGCEGALVSKKRRLASKEASCCCKVASSLAT